MKTKRIIVPTAQQSKTGRRTRNITKKRTPSPIRLETTTDETKAFNPTLVFRRRYPKSTWLVPPLQVPLYWFDRVMVNKGLLIPIPPNTFVCDGRRFKVLAQDQKWSGRYPYTRWLVYEELAVPKGEKP